MSALAERGRPGSEPDGPVDVVDRGKPKPGSELERIDWCLGNAAVRARQYDLDGAADDFKIEYRVIDRLLDERLALR